MGCARLVCVNVFKIYIEDHLITCKNTTDGFLFSDQIWAWLLVIITVPIGIAQVRCLPATDRTEQHVSGF